MSSFDATEPVSLDRTVNKRRNYIGNKGKKKTSEMQVYTYTTLPHTNIQMHSVSVQG
jgi:hypothetical protein